MLYQLSHVRLLQGDSSNVSERSLAKQPHSPRAGASSGCSARMATLVNGCFHQLTQGIRYVMG
jgi:hypothetical protein